MRIPEEKSHMCSKGDKSISIFGEDMKRALKLVSASVLALATLVPATAAQAATSYTSDSNKPNVVTLLGEYNNWWTPKSNTSNASSDVYRGSVTEAGKSVLAKNDALTESINNTTASDTATVDGTHTQAQRALIDADQNAKETYSDALGPILSKFLVNGLNDGSLPKTNALLFASNASVTTYLGTGAAKQYFNYPRPFFTVAQDGEDRSMSGENNLNGLQSELNISRIADWTDSSTGLTHSASYASMFAAPSQAFPSGHTTYAYSAGIGLATLLPELGTEIVTRASEAGNNRIALGVHYPLDVMGGRINGEAANVARWSDETFRSDQLLPAREELVNYMTAQCKAAGYGDTLQACIDKTGANATGGYTNTFTDAVSTTPVTDRASAISAYTSRLTYGFQQTSAAGKAAVVPDGAENLLLTAFPSLTDAQRKSILAASEIDSGYPFDSTSSGYERLNLAKAYSANVTLSADKQTILSITFGNSKPSVTVSGTDAISDLLADFGKYWQAGVGVTEAGSSVLKHDDDLTVSINNKAASETAAGVNDQQARAVVDAEMNSEKTLHDALGTVIGGYYEDGVNSGKLSKTTAYLKAMSASASTGTSKTAFSHPRPYVDRENYNGTTLNLNGLQQTLGIKKVAAYEQQGQYDGLASSGSFPSGHTTFAFTQGAGLASILPEFGTQIMTRVSEAGNNRIVLGVHYPLDIMGGHIAGQYGVATALEDQTTSAQESSARQELVSYLTSRCKADGYGESLESCITATQAKTSKGYHNSFTDSVSTKTVSDTASAISAYTSRMTYGFTQTGKSGQFAVVPDAAVNLLRNVPGYSTLSDAQLKQVLALTEIDSGYPLDSSSEGWGRINLAAAYSAKVTVNAKGEVVKVTTGQNVASVETQSDTSTKPGSDQAVVSSPTSTTTTHNGAGAGNNASNKGGALATTGAQSAAMMAVAAVLLISGAAITIVVRKRKRML
jgi:membrane-associated phospholipid phosphatase